MNQEPHREAITAWLQSGLKHNEIRDLLKSNFNQDAEKNELLGLAAQKMELVLV